MVTVRLLKAVELEDEKTVYFEKKFSIEKECLNMTIVDEDGSYEPEDRLFDAANGEVIGRMAEDNCDDEDEFNQCVEEMKGSGWRMLEDLPPRLKDIL